MKKIQIEKFGGPEVLQIKDVEIGKPGPKEVLIKNLSIGLNYIDVYHRTGLYPIPLPSGIGLEACGIIEEVVLKLIYSKLVTESLTLQCQLVAILKNNYFLKKN